jgi:hypothetical protein
MQWQDFQLWTEMTPAWKWVLYGFTNASIEAVPLIRRQTRRPSMTPSSTQLFAMEHIILSTWRVLPAQT